MGAEASTDNGVKWIPDEERTHCHTCEAEFTVINRRHHCRRCGEIFCEACAATYTALPRLGYKSAVRVCGICKPQAERENEYDSVHAPLLHEGAIIFTAPRFGKPSPVHLSYKPETREIAVRDAQLEQNVSSDKSKRLAIAQVDKVDDDGDTGFTIVAASIRNNMSFTCSSADEKAAWVNALRELLFYAQKVYESTQESVAIARTVSKDKYADDGEYEVDDPAARRAEANAERRQMREDIKAKYNIS